LLFARCALAQEADVLPPNIAKTPGAEEALVDSSLTAPSGPTETALEKSVDHARKKMSDDYGITPFVSYWGDFLGNPTGGLTQSVAYFQLLQFGADIDFDRYGWQGGSFYLSGSYASGTDLSQRLGNLLTPAQAVVNLTDIGLDEVYFTQKVGKDDFLKFSVGRMAPASDFATLPVEDLAVSGATNGNPISLYLNAPFFTFTGASWAGLVEVKPSPETYTQLGVYQTDPRTDEAPYHGLNVSIRPGDGVLMMLETGWKPVFGEIAKPADKEAAEKGYPGVYQVGSYFSHYTFPTFGGGSQPNAYGFYLQGQQMVWRDPAVSQFNLTVWGGVTYSPQQQIAQIPVMGFGGVELHGPIPGRRHDSLFMNGYVGHLSPVDSTVSIENEEGPLTSESVLEWGYVMQVTKHLQFQPDVQYIMHPSGMGSIPNALVAGFQVSALF
jgi:porin